MVRGMGETSFEELLPWLMATLTSEASSVDRSGAAQVKYLAIHLSSYRKCGNVCFSFVL